MMEIVIIEWTGWVAVIVDLDVGMPGKRSVGFDNLNILEFIATARLLPQLIPKTDKMDSNTDTVLGIDRIPDEAVMSEQFRRVDRPYTLSSASNRT